MSDYLSINTSQFLQLDTNIRTSSTSAFNAQDAYENVFEDVMSEKINEIQQEETKLNKVNFSYLGPPAGFFLDVSMLSEEDKIEVSSMFNTY